MKRFLFVVILFLPHFAHGSEAYDQCRNRFLHGQYSMAEESCLIAANEGNLEPQKWLAFMYTKGKGVEQDSKKAFFWRDRAAKAGDANSQYHLGRFYQLGIGVEQDFAKARYWYEKSCRQGDMNGLYAMGNLYRKGLGVKVNLLEAYGWYSLAAEKNMLLAEQTVERMEETMSGQQIAEGKKMAAELAPRNQ
jgi:TPR repeat protein